MKGSTRPPGWIVSARWDVAVFGGSAFAALALLVWAKLDGRLSAATPLWAWVATVVAVDVAHVWSTFWRVYADADEMRRRPALYYGTPLVGWLAGVVLYSASSAMFWRCLAYLAVFHFVRQQYGWVALYRRRCGTTSRIDRVLDDLAIYGSTLYPLLWWHANLPREFAWFLEGDFIPGLPKWTADALLPVHVAIMLAFAGRQAWLLACGKRVSWGKNLVVWTTWACWFGGIVVLNSDYAFTVTNVLIHGIPYMALTWVYGRGRWSESPGSTFARAFRPGLGFLLFLAPLISAAFMEEWLWDRLVWHDHPKIFPGPAMETMPDLLALLVPLLAIPQITHYVLDGFIWRVGPKNPELARRLGFHRP